ncbi:hypothetical protein AB0B27_31105 [Micromonospora rifamycinica]|uniref:hypothetical protein n=1 Tax=Micromonospora rifamycinica TaxID=291594 RepID=UPI0033EBB911
MRRRPGRPTVLPHTYVRQDGVPADPWSGLAPCRECRKLGRAGDAQHPVPGPDPLADAAAELEARKLGERE